ncbi:MAG: alpha-xylosidase, partial [Clostridia bacterium]|nr:alpha-xylosidase [Clostridia bacterium]
GFEATATPDIYKRWCAFGLLSTHSRLHGNSTYRVPWLFDEESCDVLRFFTRLKGRLMPYMFSQAVKTHITGIPMMRAMVIDFADDPACHALDRQYMLGDDLLCAPILNDASVAEFYVPSGRWTDIITGRVYEGEKWYRTECSYFQMPILARPSSIVVYGNFERDFEYEYLDGAEVVIYELGDGETASAAVYDKNAVHLADIRAERIGDRITVHYTKTDRSFTVKLAGTDLSVRAEAGSDTVVLALM